MNCWPIANNPANINRQIADRINFVIRFSSTVGNDIRLKNSGDTNMPKLIAAVTSAMAVDCMPFLTALAAIKIPVGITIPIPKPIKMAAIKILDNVPGR